MQVTIESLMQEIAMLKEANAELAEAKTEAENMLDYERNKYERMLDNLEKEIKEGLRRNLKMELEAVRENAQYVDAIYRKRIVRRCDRIDEALNEPF